MHSREHQLCYENIALDEQMENNFKKLKIQSKTLKHSVILWECSLKTTAFHTNVVSKTVQQL